LSVPSNRIHIKPIAGAIPVWRYFGSVLVRGFDLDGSSHVLLKKVGYGDLSILVLIVSNYRYERSLCWDQYAILTGA
jgi:hypothetical protein